MGHAGGPGNDSPGMVGKPRLIHGETAAGKSLCDILLPQSLSNRHWGRVKSDHLVSTFTYIIYTILY